MPKLISAAKRRVKKVKSKCKKTGQKAYRVTAIWFKLRHHYAWHYKNSPVEDDIILFESFHGKTMSDSPLYMLREFLNDPRSEDFRIYYATYYRNLKAHRALAASIGLEGVEFVSIESWWYVRLLATAKYLVNNSSFPSYFVRRPEQRYIQTWHGTPLKTLGKQMRLGMESMYNVQHNFLQASVLTFPNEFTRDVLMRDYNLEDLYTGKTAIVGYPRNQVFFDTDKAAEIRTRYGLDGIETIAYMPTWRGVNNYSVDVNHYREEVLGFLEAIDAVLDDNQKMFVNFHSMVAERFGTFEFEHIFPFPEDADNYEFLNAMDALITDYSSVFFDYSITRKPIMLFVYDAEKYLEQRGMYLNLEDLPFPKLNTIEELVDMIESKSYRAIDYAGSDYERTFLTYDSPKNARIALDLLFGEESADVPMRDYAVNKARPWTMVESRFQKYPSDIRTICEATDPEHDIIVFSKTAFNRYKSQLVHDEYRDGRNYIFTNKAYNCTAFEELLLPRSEIMKAMIEKRELQRNLPNLKVTPRTNPNMYAGRPGTDFIYEGNIPRVNVTVSTLKNGALALNVDPGTLELKAVLLAYGRKIVDRKPLEPHEIETNVISESLMTLAQSDLFGTGGKPYVYVDGIDKITGEFTCAAASIDREIELVPGDRLPSVLGFTKGLKPDGTDALYALFQGTYGALHLIRAEPIKLLRAFKQCSLVEVASRGGCARIRVRVRTGGFTVTGFLLTKRVAVDSESFSIPFTTYEEDEWTIVEGLFNPSDYPFTEAYWDAYLELDYCGTTQTLYVHMSRKQIRKLKFMNQQWRIGEDKVLFTHIKKGSNLSFVYRDYYPDYDTYMLRLKEFTALVLIKTFRRYWKRKRVWLVFEKFCALAQDNGYYFFEYCMSLPEEERDHIYYVIDKRMPDYRNVAPYDDHVLDFMSFKHILYSMVAKIYIASDSRTHLYVWRNKPSAVRTRIGKKKVFFLQHGVTALKRVDYLFGKKGSSPMTYFLTTSLPEQDIVVEHFKYGRGSAPILGFSRWDVLEDRSSKDKPSILLMPTWRMWLEEQSDQVFRESDYYKAYSSLINSPELIRLLERYNATLKFFIHPKLSYLLKNFGSDALNERIELIEQGSKPLNEIMMECNALITDYSSVCWDMLYMDKPIVYYQFDQELYEETVGSYIDLNEDLPGDVCFTEKEVLDALDACAERGFTLRPEHAEMAETWFEYKDHNNRQRAYEFIVSKGL